MSLKERIKRFLDFVFEHWSRFDWDCYQQKEEKPINLESIGKDFFLKDSNGIHRKCPICNTLMSYSDFMNVNGFDDYTDKIWKNPKVAIPCCSCFKRLEAEKK